MSNQIRRTKDHLEQERVKTVNERINYIKAFSEDPYVGYPTIDEALADYKCTTSAEVLARLLNRENVFISGPAGAGKTFIVDKFIKLIDAQYDGNFTIAVTASTGKAASSLENGVTIHSWAGLGVDTSPFDKNNIHSSMWSRAKNMQLADILIIDEISMVPAYLFEKLDKVLRHFRRSSEPFGGIQVVFMGDFLQLPPVDTKDKDVNCDFVFNTSAWKSLGLSYCYMDKNQRATDPVLASVLSKISRGIMDDEGREVIESCKNKRKSSKKTYTTLFTTNNNVDNFNRAELAKNPSALKTIHMTSSSSATNIKKIVQKYKIPEVVELKAGATVMLTSNINDIQNGLFYANGSIGEITRFIKDLPIVRFNDGRELLINRKSFPLEEKKFYTDKATGQEKNYLSTVATVEQIPLKLGYAITVHKSQGQTFDAVVVDLSKCFTPGLGYVALSRVRSLNDLIIKDINEKAYYIDPKSKKISNYVKKRALDGRREFIEKFQEYDALLCDEIFRSVCWNVDAAIAKRKRLKGR